MERYRAAVGLPVAPRPTRRGLLRTLASGSGVLAGLWLGRAGAVHAVQAQAAPSGGQPPAGASIVGSWLIRFPGGGGASQDPNERQVVSFTSDGIVINAAVPSVPVTPGQGPPGVTRVYSTAGQGVWAAAGSGQANLVFVSVDYDDQGAFADLVRVTATLTLSADGNSFTGTFGVQVTDAAGNVLFSQPPGSGMVQGTRITL